MGQLRKAESPLHKNYTLDEWAELSLATIHDLRLVTNYQALVQYDPQALERHHAQLQTVRAAGKALLTKFEDDREHVGGATSMVIEPQVSLTLPIQGEYGMGRRFSPRTFVDTPIFQSGPKHTKESNRYTPGQLNAHGVLNESEFGAAFQLEDMPARVVSLNEIDGPTGLQRGYLTLAGALMMLAMRRRLGVGQISRRIEFMQYDPVEVENITPLRDRTEVGSIARVPVILPVGNNIAITGGYPNSQWQVEPDSGHVIEVMG